MDNVNEIQKRYGEIIEDIFLTAFKANAFHFLATILRFDGMFFGHWDPLEESKETFADLSVLLEEADKSGKRKREIKIALLMYCHAIEMTQVHQIIANLLRICGGKPFKFRALWDEKFMQQRKKDKSLFFKPPSLGNKRRQLKELAKNAGKYEIGEVFDEIFNLKIRNSFSHSDYCIDLEEKVYRNREGGPAQQMKLEDLDMILNKTFAFYSEFFRVLEAWHYQAAKMPKFHKFPDYEVLELLVEQGKLYGFNIHHSDGTKSVFERTPHKVNLGNFDILDEGIGVVLGELDKLKKGWYVGDEEITDFEAYNRTHTVFLNPKKLSILDRLIRWRR